MVPEKSKAPPPANDVIADMLGNMMTSNAHVPRRNVRSSTRCQQNPEEKKVL